MAWLIETMFRFNSNQMACNDVNWSFFQTCNQVIMSDLFPSKQGIESNQRSEQGQINVAISVGWCLTSKSCALDLTPSHYNKIPVFFSRPPPCHKPSIVGLSTFRNDRSIGFLSCLCSISRSDDFGGKTRPRRQGPTETPETVGSLRKVAICSGDSL